MPFYEFRQNNSGGGFDIAPERGITVTVIIEADGSTEANERAESLGIYFNGCDTGQDCTCCGDRWYAQWADDDGKDVPSLYGTPIDEAENSWGWAAEGVPEAIVHYKDGRHVGYVLTDNRYIPQEA